MNFAKDVDPLNNDEPERKGGISGEEEKGKEREKGKKTEGDLVKKGKWLRTRGTRKEDKATAQGLFSCYSHNRVSSF